MRWSVVAAVAACTNPAPVPVDGGDSGVCGFAMQSWSAADALFRNDPAWVGADAAYSVDLGGGRVLWLFGDSFIAKSPARSRSDAWFVRNSVAVETGYDPTTASIAFAWQTTGGAATSFFPESGTHWFWPLDGIRLPTRLVLFLLEEEQSGLGSFGFQAVGTKVVFVTNPDASPLAWNVQDGNLPALPFPVAFGSAVVRDGAYIYAFGVQEPGDHSVYVARFDAAMLDGGDASRVEFLVNGAWAPAPATVPDTIFPSTTALENPPTELSVQKRPDGSFLAVHSVGFGATTIAVRTAPAAQGPWSAPCIAFTPPESGTPNVLVYAAKAHPELQGGSLVVTYATNGTNVTTDMSLYFPRFVRSP